MDNLKNTLLGIGLPALGLAIALGVSAYDQSHTSDLEQKCSGETVDRANWVQCTRWGEL